MSETLNVRCKYHLLCDRKWNPRLVSFTKVNGFTPIFIDFSWDSKRIPILFLISNTSPRKYTTLYSKIDRYKDERKLQNKNFILHGNIKLTKLKKNINNTIAFLYLDYIAWL